VEYDDEIIKILLQNDFVASTFWTTIIELNEDEMVLWKRIRECYHSLINLFAKHDSAQIKIVDAIQNIQYFEDWIKLYSILIARGGQSLSPDAVQTLRTGILDGTGVLYLLYQGTELIAGTHVNLFGDSAYYSASGIHPSHEGEYAYTHYVLYQAILDLKRRGLSRFEIGPIFYKQMDNFYTPSEKELSISHFKLGMGGTLTPFVVFRKMP
jgi:hypothetical protein